VGIGTEFRLDLPKMVDRRNEVDAIIAATAVVHGLTVGTRTVQDFQGAGVIFLNPSW